MSFQIEIRGIPSEHSDLTKAFESMIESTLKRRAELAATGGAEVDYGAVESEVSGQLSIMEVVLHSFYLPTLDIDAPHVRVWGKDYRRVGRYPGQYRCLGGPVTVERTLYRRAGERSGETVDAISLRTGAIADGWLPRAARAMGHLLAKGTSREAEATSRELARLPYSRSSFERVGHAVGAQLVATRTRVEEALIESQAVPDEATSLSVSIDRVSIPMEEKIEAPKRRRKTERQKELEAAAKNRPHPPKVSRRAQAVIAEAKREAKRKRRKVERNYRMAWCGTVTLHDAEGRGLHTIRYGRMPNGDTRGMMRGLARDVRVLLTKRPELRVVFLADGAPELWNLYEYYLNEKEIGVRAIRLVDVWHLFEYLAPAATLMEQRAKAWPGQFRRWKKSLLEKPGAAREVLKSLEASNLSKTRLADGTCPVGDAIRYLSKRLRMTRYAAARRLGLPIGSGNVEATCKSLVSLRMKRPGSRWKQTTGEEVLQLRALYLSDRWEAGVTRAFQPLRKSIKEAA